MLVRHARAYPEKEGIRHFRVQRKVLRRKAGRSAYHVAFPHGFSRRRERIFVHFFAVCDRRGGKVQLKSALALKRPCGGLDYRFKALERPRPRPFVKASHAARHLHRVHDEIFRHAAVYGAYADDHGVGRVDIAADYRIHGAEYVSGAGYRILYKMRHGAVSADARYRYFEIVLRRHQGTLVHDYPAAVHLGTVVQPVHPVGSQAFKKPVFYDKVCALAGLLARLEQQYHVVFQLRLMPFEQLRRTQKRRRVKVVTAGVHHALVLGLHPDGGGLVRLYAVDVRTEKHCFAAFFGIFTPYYRNCARFQSNVRKLCSNFVQPRLYERRRFMLVHGRLGYPVQRRFPADKLLYFTFVKSHIKSSVCQFSEPKKPIFPNG